MQKNNLPDNWREVRSDTKSKPRIDYSTPFKFLYASFRKSRRKIKIRWTMKPIRRISTRRRNPKSIFRQLFAAHSTISQDSVQNKYDRLQRINPEAFFMASLSIYSCVCLIMMLHQLLIF